MTSINTRAGHLAAVGRMGELSRQLDSVQGQIARARRIDVPADDPVGFARAAVLRREQAAAAATQRGIDAGNRRLSATDTALESLGNLVQRARELALQGANGTQSDSDRATIALEIRELAAQARTLAETTDSDGQRLFGGANASGPAYAAPGPGGSLAWQGGGSAPAVGIGSSSVASGSDGPSVFGITDPVADTRDLFATLTALDTALATPDAALRQAGIDTAIGDLDGHIDRIANARGTTGARLSRLEAESERLAKAKLATESDLSRLESLDMPEAIARMQRLLTVLEAAQASFVRISSLSLWDQLR
jgi:flagellar hook-associated protein 3 FlgL